MRSAIPVNAVLEADGLVIRRGNIGILNGIDWQVRGGENWAILGANGAGKTSLLKSITGYLAPTSGSIWLLGRQYGRTDWRKLRGRVGIVTSAFGSAIPPAEPAIETVMSGRYAQLDLWARTTRRDRAEATKLLESAGVASLANREWAYLSQGERQRVLISRALMGKPEVLIFDEPCAGLDPVAREEFLGYVEKLARAKSSPALILVTHHTEEITHGFSHVLMLDSGRVVASGPKQKVMTSANLSRTFGKKIGLRKNRSRYWLTFLTADRRR